MINTVMQYARSCGTVVQNTNVLSTLHVGAKNGSLAMESAGALYFTG